jgi:hypothetical protein
VHSSGTASLSRCTLIGDRRLYPTLVDGMANLTAPLVEVNGGRPTLGSIYPVLCNLRPSEPTALLLTMELAATTLPVLEQPTWALGGASIWAVSGLADQAGRLSFTFTVPNNVALRYRSLWCHTVGGASVPLQLGVPVGGIIL